jgi:Serpin (serine protease inhibitor)
MKKHLLIFLVFTACQSAEWSDLPPVVRLETLPQTEFVATLENPITANKNAIYAPAFLFAWDKIKTALHSPVLLNESNSADFKLLNQSVAHQKTLNEDEYSATVSVEGDHITARAFFNKTLAFETEMQALTEPILFGKTKVQGFGMNQYRSEIAKNAQILYYKDDANFILKLIPKDQNHEIILIKGLTNYTTLQAAIAQSKTLVNKGIAEAKQKKSAWKYEIKKADIFEIPCLKFNIATNYKTIEGQNFTTQNGKPFQIDSAYQRIGFILNEKGAVVESEAEITAAAVDAESIAPPTQEHPKNMVFDRPFLMLIKRVQQQNPYFAMRVEHAEVLCKK